MIFKKIMSIALTTAIVLGCGATLNAASSGYKIDDTFPDPALKKFVRQFDLNSDGYLDPSEIKVAGNLIYEDERNLSIKDPNICDLTGLEIFTSCPRLFLSNCKIKKLDATCLPFSYVNADDLPELVSFVCGCNTKTVYLLDCPKLKKTYFNYAFNLERLYFADCPSLSGSVCLDNCSKLFTVEARRSNITDLEISKDAEMYTLLILKCPLKFLDMRGKMPECNFIIQTDGKAQTSMTVGFETFNFLYNHRRPNNQGYEYNTGRTIKNEVWVDMFYSQFDLNPAYKKYRLM